MTPRMLPLALTSVVIFALACLFPIMTVSLHGIHNEVTLYAHIVKPGMMTLRSSALK
ncbi:paraquat-inducible protein A [Brenneria sp. 4F2]|nr:paraquat-inducible protein A [Brenneria bubanii]